MTHRDTRSALRVKLTRDRFGGHVPLPAPRSIPAVGFYCQGVEGGQGSTPWRHRDVSRLCSGLPGQGGSPAETGEIRLGSGAQWSDRLLGEDAPAGGGGGGGRTTLLRLTGASSSQSASSMRGISGAESSMRNSGWLMKLWMELRASGVSRPS
ncbi:hypothetical protein EYF80_044232 [Liparis tanakae]|uniref:Uncharacterized protein n=1 Tax=Liparis tanakae TaxID=230148 RepID=A0A4Z2FXF1_9TELE|nr:hypothetical protein EYF80_044232 [Liparis tanakae]